MRRGVYMPEANGRSLRAGGMATNDRPSRVQSHTVQMRGKISKSRINSLRRCLNMQYYKLSTLVALLDS